MRTLLLLAITLSSAACLRQTEFKCSTSADCSASGAVCEANGYCSFVDPNCAGGRRFGDLSGPVAGQCVGGNTGLDGGIVDTMIDSSTGMGCPGTYAALPNVTTHRYRVLSTMTAWMTQKTACSADGTNAYLAVPNDATELAALLTATNATRTWVGIDDQAAEGTYVTANGGSFSMTDPLWSAGQPDNLPFNGGGDSDCVAGVKSSTRLADTKCVEAYPAVCECEP